MTIEFEMVDDDALLDKVKAAILALLAASGASEMSAIQEEIMMHVAEINMSNVHDLARKGKEALLEEGMIKQDTEFFGIVYDLTDAYYSSEHNPDNYDPPLSETEAAILSQTPEHGPDCEYIDMRE